MCENTPHVRLAEGRTWQAKIAPAIVNSLLRIGSLEDAAIW